MKFYIYKIENIINKKCYIGQSKDFRKRWAGHKRLSKLAQKKSKNEKIQPIHFAIAKYGIDNFTFEIIDEVSSLEESNQKEIYWIDYYNSYKSGYNCDKGGNQYHRKDTSKDTIKKRKETYNKNYGSKVCNAPECNRIDGFKYNGVRYCEKHIQRLKTHGSINLPERPKPHLGKPKSSKTKTKISNSLKGKFTGKNNPFFGKKHSKETIAYLKSINTGKEPANKIIFSKEEICKIKKDSRSLRKIAKDWGVSTSVIIRIKKI